MPDASSQPDQSARRIDLILRMAIVTELTLIGSTWRLWFDASNFPRVAVAETLTTLPPWLLPAASAALVIVLVLALFSGWQQRSGPRAWLVALVVVCSILPVLLNQHCLQAWHWLFLLTMSLSLLLRRQDTLTALRRLVPCIYLFAALSRFGPAIDTGMSPRIVRTLLDLAGLTTVADNPQTLSWLCVAVTVFELLAGLLLLLPRTRRAGLVAAVTMHLSLLAALGPLGMQQHAAVLVWNACLAAWVVALFAGLPEAAPSGSGFRLQIATAFCFLWPTLALIGITDNWTGWQLYSPRPEVLQLQLHTDSVAYLPDDLQPHVSAPEPLQDWCNVRLDRWSLESVGVPMYPQARFQLAVAVAATAGVPTQEHVRATLNAPESPQWWNRSITTWSSRVGLVDALSRSRLAVADFSGVPDAMTEPTPDDGSRDLFAPTRRQEQHSPAAAQ